MITSLGEMLNLSFASHKASSGTPETPNMVLLDGYFLYPCVRCKAEGFTMETSDPVSTNANTGEPLALIGTIGLPDW